MVKATTCCVVLMIAAATMGASPVVAQVVVEGPYVDTDHREPTTILPTVPGWVRVSVPPAFLQDLKLSTALGQPPAVDAAYAQPAWSATHAERRN